MSKARLIITAVVDEKRTKSEVARDYDVSRYWVQQLVRRYLAEGEAAFEPHSRRPHTSPHAVPAGVEDEIVRLRKELSRQGLDAGADTIRTHLARRTPRSQTSSKTAPPSVSTIWRILARRGFLTPQPQKRPRSSWRRFEAEQPNQRWQADTTHWQLADGTPVEILNLLDDHSRLALACVPRRTITGPDVVGAFGDAFVRWGIPASVLTDNGAIFTGLPRRGGRVALEIELGRLGVRFDHSRANHPQTQGKVERFQQTEKKWLAAQPPAKTTAGLQRQLTRFRRYYNEVRPHRALDRRTPWDAYTARPKATATGPYIEPHCRVRRDRVDKTGTVTLRYNSRLHHIGLGRLHAGTRVTLLIDDLHIRVIDRHTGELLRELTLDPSRDFQPRGLPPGPPRKNP
ncbi:MAG TPA: IS481 family transposase [Nocardioidaceae bacterium]|nr:IS481 family transposase [Nocardioidaceae bacterium]